MEKDSPSVCPICTITFDPDDDDWEDLNDLGVCFNCYTNIMEFI